MDGNASFGYWVRRRRKALDLTQDELAQRVSCALSTIRKIEADERRPSREFAERLVVVLEVAPAEQAAFLKAARAALSADQLASPVADIVITPVAAVRPSNLPAPATALVGRRQELAQTSALLRAGQARLLTLTGPGGVGKTRLAIALAEDLLDAFADGVWFVGLAPIRDTELVISAIAQALDQKERGGQSLLDDVKSFLHGKTALLVLDNFEQVAAAGPLVAELLAAAPQLKALVTSRERLHLTGEHEFPIPTLSLPPRATRRNPDPVAAAVVEQLAQFEAIDLFVQRARAAKPGFALSGANVGAVAELCARLDGLPLAIELAAARCKMFAPMALLARLKRRLPLLTGGAHDLPTRHQTLRDTIDWSYDLLQAGEQALFARLGVFAGGCTVEAAEAVCREQETDARRQESNATASRSPVRSNLFPILAALVDKSLVYQEDGPDGEPRFFMLETIREYAQERLEQSGEANALRQAHAGYFVALAEQAEPELIGPQQAEWLERLECEHDNLRAALAWSLEQGAAETAARLGGALSRFWHTHGHLSEGRRWLASALTYHAELPPPVQAAALHGAGTLAFDQNDYRQATALLEEGLTIQRALRNQPGVATALIYLGAIFLDQGDHDRARIYTEECLQIRRRLGDRRGVATALNNLGNLALSQNNFAKAQELYSESLVLCRAVGDKREIANAISNLGLTAYYQGDHEQATILCTQSLELFQKLGDQFGEANVLSNMGAVASARGDLTLAMAYLTRCLEFFHILNHPIGIAESLERLAEVAAAQSQPTNTARLLGAAEAIRDAIGAPLSAVERTTYEQVVDATRNQLDDIAFDAAWAAGRALTFEQAIAEALQLAA